MNDSHLERIALIIGAVVAALIGSSYLVARPTPASRVPPADALSRESTSSVVTWTPTSTEAIVSPGETKTIAVSFVASKNVRRASVEISPELAPFVRAEPVSYERIRKGEQSTLNIIVAPAANAALGTATGTIQLRRGKVEQNDPDSDEDDRSEAGKLLPQALAVTVNVWQALGDTGLGISLKVPDFGTLARIVADQSATDTKSTELELFRQDLQRFVPVVGMRIYQNSASLNLLQWFQQNIDVDGVLATSGTFQQQQLENGLTALVLVRPVPAEFLEQGGPVDEIYVISPSGDRVLSISQAQDFQLTDFGYAPDAAKDLLKRILGTLQFL